MQWKSNWTMEPQKDMENIFDSKENLKLCVVGRRTLVTVRNEIKGPEEFRQKKCVGTKGILN